MPRPCEPEGPQGLGNNDLRRCRPVCQGPTAARTDRSVRLPLPGEDACGDPARIGRSRTGPGLRILLSAARPFPLSARPLPQPPACGRLRRDHALLRARCGIGATGPAGTCSRFREADARRAGGGTRRQGGRRPVPLGRDVARRRLRLLRPRLLGIRAARPRPPAQLVCALRPGQAGEALEDEARRPALLLRARPRRYLRRPRAHGARPAFRHSCAGRLPQALCVWRATRGDSSHDAVDRRRQIRRSGRRDSTDGSGRHASSRPVARQPLRCSADAFI